MNPLGMIKSVAVGVLKVPVRVVGSVVGPAKDAATPSTPPASSRPQAEPVNVTEELGLDPAPVEKPQAEKSEKATTEPTTSIDAAADPSSVDVTPADVAEVVGKDTR